MNLAPAVHADAPAMASVHAQAFETPWTEVDFEDLLDSTGIFGLILRDDAPAGVLIARCIADEAEILTVGVAPWARRRGFGEALMTTAIGLSRQAGATAMFLEVDVANTAAIGLYERLGFQRAGLRRGYYDRGARGRADALVMRLDLAA